MKPDFSTADMKTNNAGISRIVKYGDPDAKRRKHPVVIITADVKTERIVGIESLAEGTRQSEQEIAFRQLKEAVMKGMRISKFYSECEFDNNLLFTLIYSIGGESAIKIRKNASTDQCKGSKYRRKAVKEHQEKGYGR
jgi:hypothetical protein